MGAQTTGRPSPQLNGGGDGLQEAKEVGMSAQHFATGFVLVGNRSDKDITVTYDGRSVVVPANGTCHMSPAAAQKAVQQARIFGTEDPYSPGSFQSYLYVEGWDLPRTKVKYDQSKLEALDRSLLPPDRQNPVAVNHGRAKRTDVGDTFPVTADVTFAGDTGR